MTKIDLKYMPKDFTFCSREDCKRHETCLHWRAYVERPIVERAYFYDHRWIEEQGGTELCPNYADSAPVTFACGFRHIFDCMPKTQAAELREKLLELYGEYNYYRFCRGEFLTPPAVQQTILRIAKELDITAPIQFHATETMPYWGDVKIKRQK